MHVKMIKFIQYCPSTGRADNRNGNCSVDTVSPGSAGDVVRQLSYNDLFSGRSYLWICPSVALMALGNMACSSLDWLGIFQYGEC